METAAEMLKRLDLKLFGPYGDAGVIGRLQEADEENKKLIDQRHEENRAAIGSVNKKIDNAKWLLIGIVVGCGFLTGTGSVSLDRILRVIGWLK